MKINPGQTLKLILGILGSIVLLIVISLPTGWWGRLIKRGPDVVQREATDSSKKLVPPPELSENTKKQLGLVGPFPVDDKIPKREREIGQVVNAWREAVVIKSIKEIEQLGLRIKGYSQEAVPFLRKLVLEDENERVRAFATRVLGRMRNADLSPLFMDLLQKDTSPFVRENAAWSLGELKNTNALPALQSTADNDVSERVRQVAQEAITTINKTR